MPPVSQPEPELKQQGNLNWADCVCPICMEILLEPVTLPCTHTFCKACFLETVDKANICCPLCRKRVSTWARLNGRNKTLVNTGLWKRIQEAFPTQCQRRLNGIDDHEGMSMLIPRPKVSQPGELRQEYEDQINKFVEEKRALEEAERRASEEYIQRLLAEEEERLVEERRQQEERQLEDDERMARLLSEELNASPVSDSQRNIKLNESAVIKRKKPVGHIEKYFNSVPYVQSNLDTRPSSSLLDNKENILITPTFSDFKDLSSPELPFCELSGTSSTSDSISVTAIELDETPNRTSASSKRKTGESEPTCETDSCKRPCVSSQAETTTREDFLLQEHAVREECLRKRLQQEEEDRRMAQRLQRELDREIAINRRKGSADGYLLRQKISPGSVGTSSPDGEDKPEKTSPASSGQKTEQRKTNKRNVLLGESAITPSGMQKGMKQTTLTEMFPNLGS